MMSYHLLPLLLLLTVFACGDSEEEPSSLPVGKDYILTEGKPLYVFQFGGNYSGYRMRIERDTAELFSPFDQHRERMPAYAGDSLSVFSDVQYMVYDMQPDSSLQVVLRDSSGVIGKQRYVLGERLIAHSLDEEVIGRTYRWEIEDTSLLIHFDTSSVVRNGTPEFRVNLFGTDPASGRVSRIASGISNRTDHKSTPLFFPYRPEEAGGRLAVLLITGNDAGEPLTYFTYDQMDQNSLDGPYPLKPVESVLPETVGMAELSHLLNQSFVDIAMLTDEPAAEDLK
ncbi:MAG: hypothetical protein WA952_00480, partial [Lewinella sp.]